jgi:hypothetical protein
MLVDGVTINDGGDCPAGLCAALFGVDNKIAGMVSKAIEALAPVAIMVGATLPSTRSVPLKTVLRWNKGSDDRCRDKIFGDIFMLVLGSSAAGGLVEFQAYNAEQAFLSGVEHARP